MVVAAEVTSAVEGGTPSAAEWVPMAAVVLLAMHSPVTLIAEPARAQATWGVHLRAHTAPALDFLPDLILLLLRAVMADTTAMVLAFASAPMVTAAMATGAGFGDMAVTG